MENVKTLKNQDTVAVPVERLKRMQNEIKSLKKRLKKAELMVNIKQTLTELKRNLKDPNYDASNEVEADDFLAELRNGK
jgi:rRNA processing protein Krr1/Pno1